MKLEWIETYDELLQYRQIWNGILQRSKANSIFLTWEWVSSCLEATGTRKNLCVIIVRNGDDQIVGIAPFCIQRFRFLSVFPCKILRPITNLIKASEYFDFICHPDYEERVYDCIFTGLRAKKGWNLLWVHRSADWTGATSRLIGSAERCAYRISRRPVEFANIILNSSFDEFLGGVSSRLRTKVRSALRSFSDDPCSSLERIATPAELQSALASLAKLNAARWAAAKDLGAFEKSPEELEFHRLFSEHALSNGWLRMYRLAKDDEVVAVKLGYWYDGKYMHVQEGFDIQSGSGNGNLLRALSFGSLIEEGTEEYDFLNGYSEHKRRWGAAKRHGTVSIFAKPYSAWALVALFRFWPNGRFLRRCTTGLT